MTDDHLIYSNTKRGITTEMLDRYQSSFYQHHAVKFWSWTKLVYLSGSSYVQVNHGLPLLQCGTLDAFNLLELR